MAWADKHIAELTGQPVELIDTNTPLIADDVDLGALNLATIVAEMQRLETLFSADKVIRDQYAALTKRIGQERAALNSLEVRLIDAKGAATRRKNLQAERDNAYGLAFEAIISEQDALAELYGPLMGRLAASSGTLHKLSFSVRRTADFQSWANFAEETLLDLRKAGPFKGSGSLVALAKKMLMPAWENGNPDSFGSAGDNDYLVFDQHNLTP